MGECAMARSPANNKRDETSPDNANMETGKSDMTSLKVIVTDKMLQNANRTAEEAAAEYGFHKDYIKRAVARLQKEGE